MTAFTETLVTHLNELELDYSESQIEAAAVYAAYLVEENQKLNLTAITKESAIAVKHFADSLCLLKYADIPLGASLIDVGTGAGFPGLVLKIFRPDLKLTLADSLKKRCDFLNRLCANLTLNDVTILWGRAEALGRDPAFRETFDFAAARAVAPLSVLTEYCTPFLKIGGSLLAMKAKETESAENAFATLHCVIEQTTRYTLNGENRAVLQIKKTAATPEKYPRRPGIPEKRPLT